MHYVEVHGETAYFCYYLLYILSLCVCVCLYPDVPQNLAVHDRLGLLKVQVDLEVRFSLGALVTQPGP